MREVADEVPFLDEAGNDGLPEGRLPRVAQA